MEGLRPTLRNLGQVRWLTVAGEKDLNNILLAAAAAAYVAAFLAMQLFPLPSFHSRSALAVGAFSSRSFFFLPSRSRPLKAISASLISPVDHFTPLC